MTAHQRRPGFRLPWSSDADAGDASSTDATAQSAETTEPPAGTGAAQESQADASEASASGDEMGAHIAATSATAATDADDTKSETDAASADGGTAETDATPERGMSATTQQTSPAEDATAPGFLGDLVAAMRRVADEARHTTLAELRSRVDEAIRTREAAAERRRNDIRSQAETDIAAVGDWAKAEAERIKAEAEQRVASRRARLDEQLAAEGSQVDSTADTLRAKIAEYERELETFNEQLSGITDPAAFAAAAKRMPRPPALDGSAPARAAAPEPEPAPAPAPAPEVVPDAPSAEASDTNGSTPAQAVEEAAPELEKLDAAPAAAAGDAEKYAEPGATEIVVKGLGSFGAITGFRQQLANVEGIDAVGLSLGTSGEFVFRATHRPNLDMAAAITALEGDAVEIEPRAEGGIRVTLGRPR